MIFSTSIPEAAARTHEVPVPEVHGADRQQGVVVRRDGQTVRTPDERKHVAQRECEPDRDDHDLHDAHAFLAQRSPQSRVLHPAEGAAQHQRPQDGDPAVGGQLRGEHVGDEGAEGDQLAVREVVQARGPVDQGDADRGECQQQTEGESGGDLRGEATEESGAALICLRSGIGRRITGIVRVAARGAFG
jgi:hypothetical protein